MSGMVAHYHQQKGRSNHLLPDASDYFRWGTQARRLYDRMACGPVTARDIVSGLGIFGYAKVLCEIRRRLAGTGVTVKARPVNGRRNFWEYRLATKDP